MLTKGISRGIIAKLSRKTAARGPWKLNSVWQERNTQIPVNSYSVWEESGVEKSTSTTDARRQNELQTQLNDLYSFGCVDTILLRVWSWLRTNAGGVPNTCKSNGDKRWFDDSLLLDFLAYLSGGRASNAWATCPSEGNNSWKRLLIPHNVPWGHPRGTKDLSLKDGLASD